MTVDDVLLLMMEPLMERSRAAVDHYLIECDNGEFTDQTIGDLADCVVRWMAWRLNAEKEEANLNDA